MGPGGVLWRLPLGLWRTPACSAGSADAGSRSRSPRGSTCTSTAWDSEDRPGRDAASPARSRALAQSSTSPSRNLAGWQRILSTVIRLAGNCHAAYVKVRPSVRVASTKRLRGRLREGPEDHPGAALRGASLFSRPSSNKAMKVVLIERCANHVGPTITGLPLFSQRLR